ncbi:hypothetical protein ISCGN_025032 [Ixodes scapularis]
MSPPLQCAQCKEKIMNDGRHMSCADCGALYHLGKLCSGIADSTFKTMGAGKRKAWRCRVCRQQQSGDGSRSEADLSQCASPVTTEHFQSLEARLECLTLLKANVDTLLELPTQMNQMLTLKPVVESLKSVVTEVQESIAFLSAKYVSVLSTATNNAAAINELCSETTSLKTVVTEQSQIIEHLQEELNDSEQYSRLSNIEIHGLPQSPTENLVSVVRMSTAKLEKWRCLACRGGSAKSDLSTNPPSSQAEATTFLAQLETVHQKLDRLLSWKDTVDSLHELHLKMDALLSMKQAVDTMRDTMAGMQESLNFVSSQYDSLLASAQTQDKIIKALQTETTTLRSLISDQAVEIQHLKAVQNESEQANRQCNMEIHGIPFASRENLGGILEGLARQLEVEDFQTSQVEAVHRLPARRDVVPPILVRFSSVPLKERWMACRGRLGSLTREESQPKLYFNDNLTDGKRKLFWMARTRGKEKGFKGGHCAKNQIRVSVYGCAETTAAPPQLRDVMATCCVRLGYCATEAHSWARGGISESAAAMTSLLWNAATGEAGAAAAAPARQLCAV